MIPSDGRDVFAPPGEAPPAGQGGARRLFRFLLERSLRIAVSVLVMVSFVGVLLDRTWTSALFGAGLALMLWGPTTAILFKTTFLPGTPHPKLRDSDGHALCLVDVVQASRCGAIEYFLTAAPWLFLAFYVGKVFGPYGVALGVLLGAWSLRGVVSALKGTEHEVARVESAVGMTERASRRLRRLLNVTWGTRKDAIRHTLAHVYFRAGDTRQATEQLDAITDPGRWYVVPLRAQMVVARDPEAALAALAHPDLSDGEATLIQWLVDLHQGHPERVRAGHEATEALLLHTADDVTGVLHLLLAAAFADTEPQKSEEHLRQGGWSGDELPWLEDVWPAVAKPLRGLQWP